MKKSLTVFPCVISAILVIYHLLATLSVNDEHNCVTNTDIVSPDRIDETAPPEEEIPYVPISEIDLDEDLAFLVDYDVVVPNIYLEVEDLNGSIIFVWIFAQEFRRGLCHRHTHLATQIAALILPRLCFSGRRSSAPLPTTISVMIILHRGLDG